MDKMGTVATVVSICVGIVTLLGSGLAIGAYWMKTTVDSANSKLKESLKTDIAGQASILTTQISFLAEKITGQTLSFQSLKSEIMDRIDSKLDDYVRRQTFEDYKNAHAKEHEEIQREVGALRQFKHDTNTLLREHEVKIKDSQQDISKMDDDRGSK